MNSQDKAFFRQKASNLDAYVQQLQFAIDEGDAAKIRKISQWMAGRIISIQKRIAKDSAK